jgi:hypothetical protein
MVFGTASAGTVRSLDRRRFLMFRSSLRARLVMTAALVSTLSGAVPAFAGDRQVAASAAPSVTVVMMGLDNPRGLTFGKGGALYVAEAGRGGSGPCTLLRGQEVCFGRTGAVTRLHEGVQQRLVTGLPSYAPSTGEGATGPHDVSLRHGRIYIPIGLGAEPTTLRTTLHPDLGWLIRARTSGTWEKVADIAGYEQNANPDGGPHESNPYGLLAGAGGRLVVDAAGNSLLHVSGRGNIATMAVFPSRAHGRATDAVPNSVARGPDSAYYVGELTGVPFAAGAARVYRVVPGQAPQVFLEGFTAIIDLTFGPDGSLYVLQHATGPDLAGDGALIRVAPDGTRTIMASAGLVRPTSVVIAPTGDKDDDSDNDDEDEDADALTFYISNCGTCAGMGEVIRIQP